MLSGIPLRLAALFALALLPESRAGVIISEFLASNSGGLTDEDGNRPDWIELHNPDLEPVSLEGWALTDDPADLRKWLFPAVTLGPGEYLVVYASGKDRTETLPPHTNFAIENGSEPLILTGPEGRMREYWPPEEHEPNISRGVLFDRLNEDGTPVRVAFKLPTPGGRNLAASALAPAVTITPGGGTFTRSVTVTLDAPPGGAIHYTLDGSRPGANSPVYEGPLTFDATTRLRARVIPPDGGEPGPVAAATFLQVAEDLEGFTSDLPLVILDNFGAGRPNNATPAHWLVIPPGSSPESGKRSSPLLPPSVNTLAEIKVRGSSTSDAAKYSLALEAQTPEGRNRSVSPLGMPADADWVLQAPYEYDRALIRNPLMHRLSRQAGRYASRARQVEVFLNTNGGPLSFAHYAGVFTLMEKIKRGPNRVNIRRLAPTDITAPAIQGGYLLKIDRADPGDQGFLVRDGDTERRFYWVDPKEKETAPEQRLWIRGWLEDFFKTLRGPEFFDPQTGYPAWMDAGSFIDHHLLNTAAKNVDAFRLSAYFHKDRHGLLTAGPLWDFDRSMDSMDDRDDDHDTWRSRNGDRGTDFFREGWYDRLFEDSNFRQQWIDRLEEWRRTVFSPENLTAEIDGLAAEIREAQGRNFIRWPEKPPRFGGWRGEIEHLKQWLLKRLDWMDAQVTRPPRADVPGGRVEIGTRVTLSVPQPAPEGVKIYYTIDGSDPRLFDFSQGRRIVTTTFIGENHPVRVLVPRSNPGAAWRDGSPDYDDSGWISGTNGVGYDSDPTYLPYIGLRLSPPPESRRMKGVNASCMIRFCFDATPEQIEALTFLKLLVRCDDGFAAWLNGVPVASRKAPAIPQWNSGATQLTIDEDSVRQEEFILENPAALLRPGENILAVQGLNYGVNSSDFLLQLLLQGGRVPEESSEVNPRAVEYTEPLEIRDNTHLVARAWQPEGPYNPWPYETPSKKPIFSRWSAPLKISWLTDAVAPGAGRLVISEILQRPPQATEEEKARGYLTREHFEFIELTNVSQETLDLSGVQITGGVGYTIPAGPEAVLAPGARLVLTANPEAFRLRHGDNLTIAPGAWTGELRDSGGFLELRDAAGTVLESFSYQTPDAIRSGSGHSLERVNLLTEAGTPEAWRTSADPGGSPGTPPVATFADWRRVWFPKGGAESDPLADPDGDGLVNLMEFAMASSPRDASSPGPAPEVRFLRDEKGAPVFQITCARRSDTGDFWRPQTSPDLVVWTDVNVRPSLSPKANGTETAVWSVPATPADADGNAPLHRFVRLRFTAPP